MSEQKDTASLRSELIKCAVAAQDIKFYDENADKEIDRRCNDLAIRLRGIADSMCLLWQPIETAPKSIYWILLGYYPDGKPQGQHPTIAYWDGDTWVDCCGRKLKKTGAFSPTHWMPLPDSPS